MADLGDGTSRAGRDRAHATYVLLCLIVAGLAVSALIADPPVAWIAAWGSLALGLVALWLAFRHRSPARVPLGKGPKVVLDVGALIVLASILTSLLWLLAVGWLTILAGAGWGALSSSRAGPR
jgi:hypothetical protein